MLVKCVRNAVIPILLKRSMSDLIYGSIAITG
jgi:hypothetical protein